MMPNIKEGFSRLHTALSGPASAIDVWLAFVVAPVVVASTLYILFGGP